VIWLLLLAGERLKEKPLGRGRTGDEAELIDRRDLEPYASRGARRLMALSECGFIRPRGCYNSTGTVPPM
jgi:hypothetical protein